MMQSPVPRPLLLPLVPLYRLGLSLRELRLRRGWEPVRRLRYPVISVGNLSTGGSGKTPFTIVLAKLLAAKGFHVDVLSRGYGRLSKSAARVRFDGTVKDFGDEPLLIARETGAPVYVAPQRYEAGLLAEADFAREHTDRAAQRAPAVHILDDGFQHRQLARDINIVLLNRDDWRDHLLPAGNLRETLAALRRAHAIALPADQPDLERQLKAANLTAPAWRIHRRMEVSPADGPVAAFCGIARPDQFFAGLKAAGLLVATRTAFRDHHRYTTSDIDGLISSAKASGATAIITTDKDRIRLENLASNFSDDMPLVTARLTIEIEGEAAFVDWLTARFATPAAASSL
jgi:tetraacyldisaccharide 4'-kinase